MTETRAEIHQIGRQMVHLVRERIEESDEYLALIEGAGVCLANSLPSAVEADVWLRNMFARLHPAHSCGLGCIGLPGSEFLAPHDELERLLRVEDVRRY